MFYSFLFKKEKKMNKEIKAYEYEIQKINNINLNIEINELENKIFNFFLSHNFQNTTFRVAGGWVRDKLLGKNSEDIDITLDNISGQEYISNLKKENIEFKEIKNSNLKSSHLQTATIEIFNKTIDIVNLRKEIYHEKNRVPEISLGNPIDDSYRRDITINCCYYNLNTKQIEDFTNKGIEDLKNSLIRMPKDASISFNEDPLRMLRVIRFATRFQFKLDNNIIENINKDFFIKLFCEVLSNERIEKELSLMIEDLNAYASVYLLFKFNLIKYCFKFDEGKNEDFIKCVNMMICGNYLDKKFGDNYNKINRKILNYALLTSPFKIYSRKIKKSNEIGSKIILNQILKIPNNEVNDIIFIIENSNTIKALVNETNQFERLKVGLIFRNIKEKYIKKIIIVSICEEFIENNNYFNNIIEKIEEEKFNIVLQKYEIFYKYLIDEHLDKISEIKPILNGKDIKKDLNITDGKLIGSYLSKLIEEQIKNPNLTKEEAINYLKNINN